MNVKVAKQSATFKFQIGSEAQHVLCCSSAIFFSVLLQYLSAETGPIEISQEFFKLKKISLKKQRDLSILVTKTYFLNNFAFEKPLYVFLQDRK